MSFEIQVPHNYSSVELNTSYKADLSLTFDNGFLPMLAKQIIGEINISDLARLFGGEQIEELKKAIAKIELDNEASEIGLLK